ncbi:MAG: thiamine pyrophosphate-dependent dehydrogenase E1 component subunit alpha [bacterium]
MDLTKNDVLKMYETMLKIRRFEETAAQMTREGIIYGSFHTYVGEEAIATAVAANLREGDAVASTHRGNGHFIAWGADLKRMFAECLGKGNGYCKGKGGKMHMAMTEPGVISANGIVGAGLPLGTGFGLHFKIRKSDHVAISYFGDGAANQGAFHECVNMAAAWKLPVVYICENNQYAISTPVSQSLSAENVADRGVGYGIPGILVDGNDLFAVYEVVQEAIKRARAGEGPSLIECLTYRQRGHHEGDIQNYRTEEEVEYWKGKDPILRVKKTLLETMEASEEELKAIEKKVEKEVQEAAEYAKNSPWPAPETLMEDLYVKEDGVVL